MYDLEEQEQIDELKAWWKQYGRMLIVLVAGGLCRRCRYCRLAVVQAQPVGTGVAALRRAREGGARERPEADSGALGPAHGQVRRHRLWPDGGARRGQGQLRWRRCEERRKHSCNGRSTTRATTIVIATARLRLAGVLLDEKKYDEALKLLDTAHPEAFTGLFADLKGDTLRGSGQDGGGEGSLQAGAGKAARGRHLPRHRAGQARRDWAATSERNASCTEADILSCAGLVLMAAGADRLWRLPGSVKPAELVKFKPNAQAKVLWHASVGDADVYIFTPAVYEDAVYAAGAGGTLARFDAATGKQVWRVDTKQQLSGGVGADGDLVVVGDQEGRGAGLRLEGQAGVEEPGQQRGADGAARRPGRGGGAQRRRQDLRLGRERRQIAVGISLHVAAAAAAVGLGRSDPARHRAGRAGSR